MREEETLAILSLRPIFVETYITQHGQLLDM
jgi:hypothetical protein